MMKTTTTHYITKLITTKPFTYSTGAGTSTIKKGRVLEVIKHKTKHYYPWAYRIVLGHGWTEVVPVGHLKVEWYKEVKTVTTKLTPMKVN